MAPKKRGRGRPKKDATVIGYFRLTEKEEAKLQKEMARTGSTKAALAQKAIRQYLKLPDPQEKP